MFNHPGLLTGLQVEPAVLQVASYRLGATGRKKFDSTCYLKRETLFIA